MTCDNLTGIQNSIIVYTPPRDFLATLPAGTRYIGTIATYSCSPGYQVVRGSSLRACGPDGTWNGTEPICESKVVFLPNKTSVISSIATMTCCDVTEILRPKQYRCPSIY